MKACVLGLGQIGLSTCKYIISKGIDVWGYDINPSIIEKVKKEGIIKSTNDWSKIPSVDVYIICVSTTLKNNLPDLLSVFEVCKKIFGTASPSSLVSIESTITPGTSRKIYDEIFNKEINLVHVPHRYWEGDVINHGVRQLRVIGAINSVSLNAGLEFYKEKLDIPLHIVTSIEIAEMSKISENAYRYVQIAFSEELKLICEKKHIDFNELREACNTKWNIDLLEAREGIGGHCLPKDIKYLSAQTNHNFLLNGAIDADNEYKNRLKKHK